MNAQGTMCCPICMKDTPHHHEMNDRWIGVDFDHTLATDTPNRSDPYTLGEPIQEMVNRVKDWVAKGYTVKLLTARMNEISHTSKQPRDLQRMERLLQEWCLKHIGSILPCTASKDRRMEVLWDDRAVRVVKNTGGSCCHQYEARISARDETIRLLEAENVELQKDAQRLDFMVESFAFIETTKTDAGIEVYRLMLQNEDEEFIAISGAKYYATKREAIDAAMQKEKP